MIFDNYNYNKESPSGKKIKIVKNGDFERSCDFRLTNETKLSDIRRFIEGKLSSRYQYLRLFNQEGVEIMEDDLEFVKDGSTLYASKEKGEEFDANSQFSEYEIIRPLGEGGFGKVVLAVHKRTLEKVAIKIIKTQMIGNAQDIDMVFREAEILKQLNHDNIVQILNSFTLKNMQVVFIMEYLEGGELKQLLKQNGKFSEQETKEFFKQLVNAVVYCHQNKLIHRDLKLENLLLKSQHSRQIKAIDFGIAGMQSRFNVDNCDIGSLCYMAPEILSGKVKQITSAIDVWSMGIILYELLFGKVPFRGDNSKEVIDQIINDDFQLPFEVSKPCQDCLQQLLEKNPDKRIQSYNLQYHEWILNDEKKEKEQEQQVKEVQKKKKEDIMKQSAPPMKSQAKLQSASRNSQFLQIPQANYMKNTIGSSRRMSRANSITPSGNQDPIRAFTPSRFK